MKLTQMQDIGGCRAVVNDVDSVRKLAEFYRKTSGIKHMLMLKNMQRTTLEPMRFWLRLIQLQRSSAPILTISPILEYFLSFWTRRLPASQDKFSYEINGPLRP